MNEINVVYPDTSSAFLKYSLLKSMGYLNRSKWERTGTIDVLKNNYEYYNLLTQKKTPFAFDKVSTKYGQQIEASFFTDNKGYILYSTVLSYKKPSTDPELAVIESTKRPKVFASASVLLNKNSSLETTSSGLQVEAMPSVQLFRYNPVGKGYHVNAQSVRSIYPNLTSAQARLYEHYFEHTVNFPHFHFPNQSMSVSYGRNSESDAISLDSLANYIRDLIELPEDKAEVLLSNTFGMPYLGVMINPNSYTTTVNLKNLKDVATHITQDHKLFKTFNSLTKVKDEQLQLTGLTAVYADLTLLKVFRTLSKDENATQTELSLACKVASGGILYPNLEMANTTFDITQACDIVNEKTPPRVTRRGAKRAIPDFNKESSYSENEEDLDSTEIATDNPVYGSANSFNETPFSEQVEETAQMVLDLIAISKTAEQPKTLALKPNNIPPQGGLLLE